MPDTGRAFPLISWWKHGANLSAKVTAILASNSLCVLAMIPKGYKFSP